MTKLDEFLQQLGLLAVELVVGEDALGLQLAEFFDRGHDLVGFDGSCRGAAALMSAPGPKWKGVIGMVGRSGEWNGPSIRLS